MKKLLLSAAALALFGAGCLSAPPVATPPVTTGTPPATTPPVTAPPATSPPVGTPTVPTTPVAPQSINVTIQNYAFAPATIRVKKGAKIVWTNKDMVGHTVTSDSGGTLNSPLITLNQSFMLDTSSLAPGTYAYHCTPHPNMKGMLIVE